MINGIAKGIFTILLLGILLLVLSFMELMGSVFPQFNLWYLLFATIGIWQFIFLIPWFRRKVKNNKKNEGVGLLASSIIGILILIPNLEYIQNFERFDLGRLEKIDLSFYTLPVQVQNKYESNNYSDHGVFVTTHDNYKISSYNSTMDDGFWTLFKEGFKHHFIINGKHFTLQANPFILHKYKFYYCRDLN